MFLSPAVSPKRTTTLPNNPGLRLYKFNTNTGKVLDYMQIYLDLKVNKWTFDIFILTLSLSLLSTFF